MATVNDHLVLIGGKSATGKSVSLMNIKDPEGVLYLNCESGKRLPFPAKFEQHTITEPTQVFEAFAYAETNDKIHTIAVDSLTYLLDMYESLHVLTSANGMKAWGEFAQYFKRLMQQEVAKSTKSVIFTAHTADVYNETEMVMETKVPVKGSLKNNGIESYYSCILSTKKLPIKALEGYKNDLLIITDEEAALGLKYVFQTRVTTATVNERMRGPMGLWSVQETYIDNDTQKVLDRLNTYYGKATKKAAA